MTTKDIFHIEEIKGDKSPYMPLLLMGDESEAMLRRYLDRCDLYGGIYRGNPIAVCAVTEIDASTVEVKNLAVDPVLRGRGFGRSMLEYIENINRGKVIILGTGETPSTLRFYNSCGYSYSHRVPDFFTDNYPEPIVEEGVTLQDMIYLKKVIKF